jgi:hypothetical protein
MFFFYSNHARPRVGYWSNCTEKHGMHGHEAENEIKNNLPSHRLVWNCNPESPPRSIFLILLPSSVGPSVGKHLLLIPPVSKRLPTTPCVFFAFFCRSVSVEKDYTIALLYC